MAENTGMSRTDEQLVSWLLEEENPSVRYRTMTELLGIPDSDPDAAKTRDRLAGSAPVLRIFERMHPDGYWLQKHKSSGEVHGDGVMYGSFATTHFCLAYLSELGLDRSHPSIAKAADRYLDLQRDDGDFSRHFSCLNGYNIRTFVRLGFRDDPRVQKTIDLMLASERPDGGYLCDMHEHKKKNVTPKSCLRGSDKVVLAFSELPEYYDHPRCKALVDYFLRREGVFRTGDLSVPASRDAVKTAFPITWHASLTEILYALARMGYGNSENLTRAWELLETKRDSDSRYLLDWTPAEALLKGGKKGSSSKWVTLYALLAKMHRMKNSGDAS